MPFNSENAREAGKKAMQKRWAGKDPSTVRNAQLNMFVSAKEREQIKAIAKQEGLSIPELVVRAVRSYLNSI